MNFQDVFLPNPKFTVIGQLLCVLVVCEELLEFMSTLTEKIEMETLLYIQIAVRLNDEHIDV